MGIPKFYRWTSERYPCLYEKIREYQIPEFDNLYLDMNGIIHNCSHPNDEDVHLRIPEEHIFRDIFHYIDFLFRMIKPCKVFFMAVDGVAPRAKMNQQRGRRFRSARVAEEQEAEALRQGEKLPTEERFDSNCITPGTEFMARLHEQLKYFVAVKISTDPLWQRKGLCVYLSGHDVPGEGEHKIMDFIRHIRSQPNFDPETRHCLYGLDADLMMLGLSTHELRFSLLREEVKFAKPKKKKPGKNPNQNQKKTKIKDDKVPVLYDLTNVSVFSSDSNLGLQNAAANLKPTQQTTIVESQTVSTEKSFVDALNTIQPFDPTKVERKTVENQDEPPPPPSPDDHNAKGNYKAPLPEKTTFFLLHLSLFRDYLDEEFKELRMRLNDHPHIKYDLECVIDDWILMNILVGNDFVPHLPNLHIVKGALPMLYRTYMDVLPTLDGYLNESGILNLKRFETFITKLSQFDLDQFRETYDDMKYKASKTGKNIVLGEKMFDNFIFEDDAPFEEEELEPVSDELKELAKRTEDEIFGVQKNATGSGGLVCKDVFPEDLDFFSADDTEEFRLEFLQHKRHYYLTKCEFKKVDRDAVHEFAREYVRAIQWVLLYYYKGVSSWGWFYPSHYAPFASDLRRFGDFLIEFDKGQPFKPFEQLLAVLPSQSKKLLPSCYQWLMTDDASPILEYYPKKFEQDLNGKRQDWEAVVLIPFIDESKLLKAMENEASNLTQEEAFRNLRGALLCHSYTKEATGPVKSHRDIFPELEVSHVKIERIDEVLYNPKLLPKGLHPKANVSKIYQGFPSLKSKSFESCICKAEVKVFEFYAREESLILSFEDVEEEMDALKLGKKILGKPVWVNWPHLESALVTAIYTRHGKFILGRDSVVIKDPKTSPDAARKTFDLMAKGIVEKHLKFRGIKLGRIDVILNAKLMEGRKIRCNKVGKVVIETQWSQVEQSFALKTAIYEERVTEMFYMDEATAKSFLDLYRIGDQVFYLGDKLFGSMGVVTGHDKGSGSVIVEIMYPNDNDESNLKVKTGMNQLKSQDFFPPYVAATKCQISSFALSRLTGRVLVSVEKKRPAKKSSPKKKGLLDSGSLSESDSDSSVEDFPALEPEFTKYNIGLDLKFNKTNMEVRGYTSKRDGQWFYSANVVKLVNEYARHFPEVVELLGRSDKNKDIYNADDIFPADPAGRVAEIVQWLEDTGVRSLPKIPTNCNVLDDDDIDAIWNYISNRSEDATKEIRKTWASRPNLLYKPGLDKGCIAPIPNAQFSLLDRVIVVDRGAPVPLGLRGTVVGIQAPPKTFNDEEEEFKTISADALNALIIMCDPVTDIFDSPKSGTSTGEKDNGELTELTGSLAKLLGVGKEQNMSEVPKKSKDEAKAPAKPKSKPKLVKLFPYQVINLTQGARDIRQDLQKVPVQSVSRERPLLNGTVIIPSKSYAQSVMSKPNPNPSNVVKVLQKPQVNNKGTGKIPPLIPGGQNKEKVVLPWPPQPMSRSITVEQLFAQAAKEQKSSNHAKPNDVTNMIPTQLLRKPPPGSVLVENSGGAHENKVSRNPQRKVVVKTREAVSANRVQNAQTNKSSTATKVFVNSSLKDKANKTGKPQSEIKKDVMNNVGGRPLTRHDSQTTNHSSNNQNQLLNLLCQPRNLERVTSQTEAQVDATTGSKQGEPNPLETLNLKLKQKFQEKAVQKQPMHRPQMPPQPQPGFSHPVFLNGNQQAMMMPQLPPHEFYVPNPYPINPITHGQVLNPFANTFIPQNVVYFPPQNLGNMEQPPHMFMPPPPPPQHWTQHGHNAQSQRPTGNMGSSQRQTKGTKLSNVFVPLQVSRSMAPNDARAQLMEIVGQSPPPQPQQEAKPVIEAEIRPQQAEPELIPPQPATEDPIPAAKTLKALLGVVSPVPENSTEPVQHSPQPRKSRIAANFFISQPS